MSDRNWNPPGAQCRARVTKIKPKPLHANWRDGEPVIVEAPVRRIEEAHKAATKLPLKMSDKRILGTISRPNIHRVARQLLAKEVA